MILSKKKKKGENNCKIDFKGEKTFQNCFLEQVFKIQN